MTKDLVIVLAVATMIPLLLGLLPRIPVPGELAEIAVGVVVGPTVLGWVHPDEVIRALAVLGLSFLLFLGGFEVDVRCFRGRTGHGVLVTIGGSLMVAAAVGVVCVLSGVRGAPLVAIALLSTWSGPVVATLTRADARQRKVGSWPWHAHPAAQWPQWWRCPWGRQVLAPHWAGDCYSWVCW